MALVALATLCFALSDVITKLVSVRQSVPLIMAVRYIVNLGLLAVILTPLIGPRLWRVQRYGLVTLRALCLALASLTIGLALRHMPVGETVAIIYLAPFLVLLLSMPILGERVGLVGWIGCALGFAGVALIMRPGSNLAGLGITFALINAVLSAGYHLLTRFLTRSKSTVAMLFHTALVGSIVFVLLAIPDLPHLEAALPDLPLMVLLGMLATLGHFLFTAAYREAPPAALAPINYLHLVWAGGLGFLVFDAIPAPLSIIGMAMVCLAGSGVALANWWQSDARSGVRA